MPLSGVLLVSGEPTLNLARGIGKAATQVIDVNNTVVCQAGSFSQGNLDTGSLCYGRGSDKEGQTSQDGCSGEMHGETERSDSG